MKRNRFILSLFLLLAMAWLGTVLVSGVTADSDDIAVCPPEAQQGEVNITIPAGETTSLVNLPSTPCEDMNLQVTGGSMLNTPIIINANVHQGWLTIRAYLTEPQPGPVDVTVWWQLN